MIMLTQAEEKLIIAQDNDNDAFAELYKNYFPRIYNYVQYRVADFHTAEDLTSQIFEKMVAKFKYYQPEKAVFSVWLFSIARNTITDYYRSQMRSNCTSLEMTLEIATSDLDPSDIAAFNEKKQYLLKALASLSYREREIIALKFWSGCANRDIAKIIDVSESNTGVILFRAMKRLRLILESQGMKSCD